MTLQITGLSKTYPNGVRALKDLSLTVGNNMFGLLGPNGAGKTTIVRILSTLILADSGEMRVAGHDVVGEPDEVRAAIGVTGQFSAVDELLSGKENLRLMADLNHLDRGAGRNRRAAAADLRRAGRSPPRGRACRPGLGRRR